MKLTHLFLILWLQNKVYCSQPQVALENGIVSGLRETINGKDVNVFLGIPFAKPPINELRFRKPQPLTEKWKTVINATKWPNECIQSELPINTNRSEDCLYLNIWSPVDMGSYLKSNFNNKLKSVMVWIYGGAFVYGSVCDPFYNASVLSIVGDVVVVAMNYRVGALGFMYGGSDEMPGNMGLYDQRLALEWVQENIEQFGGDKHSVTIFGESAGSASVTYHLLSPESSKSLYKNGIAMSGAATDYFLSTSVDTAINIRNKIAKLFSCGSDEGKSMSRSTLDCLRKVEAEKFGYKNLKDSNSKQIRVVPVYGLPFIPKKPLEMWKETKFRNNTKLLFGLTPNEGMDIEYEFDAPWDLNKTGEELLRDYLTNQVVSETVTLSSEDLDEIMKFYFAGVQIEKQQDAYLDALGDLFFKCPSLHFGAHFAETNQVHQYLLDFDAKFKYMENFGKCNSCKPKFLGHGDDLPFTFGTSPKNEDTQISLRWIKIISDFAKTGKNNWPPYYKSKYGDLITKYYHIKNTEKESRVRIGYRRTACDFWSKIYEI